MKWKKCIFNFSSFLYFKKRIFQTDLLILSIILDVFIMNMIYNRDFVTFFCLVWYNSASWKFWLGFGNVYYGNRFRLFGNFPKSSMSNEEHY